MRVTKVIKCPIVNPTKMKLGLLQTEWDNVQHFLQTREDRGCYSRYLWDTKWKTTRIKKGYEYRICVRGKQIKIDVDKKFIRIPCKGRYGGLWLPISPHEPLNPDWEIHDSVIIRKCNGSFQINLTVSKEVSIDYSFSSLIAVDLGEKVLATTVLSSEGRPRFLGREIRGIRRHHAYIRKRLGEKKLLREIKRHKGKEQRQVDAVLHKVSRAIVDVARMSDSAIVIGDVKGIRQRCNGKGKRFNRIINTWAYNKLSQMIEYKALWEGIPVIYVNEDYTSKTCSRCGNIGTRPYQGLFKCKACGYKVNADFNGAKNILQRASEYISEVGAIGSLPLTTPASVEVGGLVCHE